MSIQGKPAKGTIDLSPEDVSKRNAIYRIITETFKVYSGQEISTPLLEPFANVQAIYGGEFDKLVYLLDSGDSDRETLFLRYDHTVPLARYVSSRALVKARLFRLGPVFRRDTPNQASGRYRQFDQADFDIIGQDRTENNIQDSEIIHMMSTILKKIVGSQFTIKVNSRRILWDILKACDALPHEYQTICSTIDKLDKITVKEMTDELIKKNISAHALVNLVLFFDRQQDQKYDLDVLKQKGYITKETYNEVNSIFSNLREFGTTNWEFDPTLARGLDYYTGIIFEAKMTDPNSPIRSSIAAGGRYDDMIGRVSNVPAPAIGVSFGIYRLLPLFQNTNEPEQTLVYVSSVGKGMNQARSKLVMRLRDNGISAETSYRHDPKMKQQLDDVLEKGYKYMITVGETEINTGYYPLKELATKEQNSYTFEEIVEKLKNL